MRGWRRKKKRWKHGNTNNFSQPHVCGDSYIHLCTCCMNICNEVITHYTENNYWRSHSFSAQCGINLQVFRVRVSGAGSNYSHCFRFSCCFPRTSDRLIVFLPPLARNSSVVRRRHVTQTWFSVTLLFLLHHQIKQSIKTCLIWDGANSH